MNDPRHQLTPQVQADICAFIRSGGFPAVAAEAAGIPMKVFDRWMKCGRATRPAPLYRDFYHAVRTAMAHARLRAENHAFEHATITWLKSGPGKETAHFPGWTSPARPKAPPVRQPGPSISQERMETLITVILGALKPFPEARAAAADALDAHHLREKEEGDLPPEFIEPGAIAPPVSASAGSNLEPRANSPSKPDMPVEEPPPSPASGACEPTPCRTETAAANAAGAAEAAVAPVREVPPAPAAPVPENKVFRPGREAVATVGQDASNLHRTDGKQQPAGTEPAEKPPRKEPTLAESLREMYRNLLQSG